MTANPKVSVIIPVYNSEKYLENTIQSVLNQSYENYEIVLIDDGSGDGSQEILKKWQQKDPKRFICEILDSNKGAAYARNRAIALSTGTFLAFLDADDLWHKQKLRNQIAFMIEQDIVFSYTDFEIKDAKGNVKPRVISFDELDFNQLLYDNSICTSSVIIKKSGFEKIQFPPLKRRQDWALWLMLTKDGNKAVRFPHITTTLVHHKHSLSKATTRLEFKLPMLIKYRWKVYRLMNLSVVKSIRYILGFINHSYYHKWLAIKEKLGLLKQSS